MTTFKGNEVTLVGAPLVEGSEMPAFTFVDKDLNTVDSTTLKGKRVFLSVPRIDTSVCSMEVAKFMNSLKDRDDVTVVSLSMDLPFALDRWCQAKNNDKVIMGSDYKGQNFAKVRGTLIEELGLLTRAVFVVDENNKLVHVEYCAEVASEPDYNKVLEVL